MISVFVLSCARLKIGPFHCVKCHHLSNCNTGSAYFILPFAAMKPQEVQEKLGLFRMRDRNWYVQPACATTGDGLYEGLTWLTSNHKS